MVGVFVDVHAWEVGYVVGGCNVAIMYLLYWTWQIWSVLPECRNCGVYEQCWLCMVCMVLWYMVCMVCWSLSYVVKLYCFIAAEHGRYGSMEDSGVSNAEYLVHLVHMNRLHACRVLWGVYTCQLEWHKMQGWCESVLVSFPSSLVGFHPYMCLFSFRKPFCDLFLLFFCIIV